MYTTLTVLKKCKKKLNKISVCGNLQLVIKDVCFRYLTFANSYTETSSEISDSFRVLI